MIKDPELDGAELQRSRKIARPDESRCQECTGHFGPLAILRGREDPVFRRILEKDGPTLEIQFQDHRASLVARPNQVRARLRVNSTGM